MNIYKYGVVLVWLFCGSFLPQATQAALPEPDVNTNTMVDPFDPTTALAIPAQPSADDWMRGVVTNIEAGEVQTDPFTQLTAQTQTITVRVTSGPDANTIATVSYGGNVARETLLPLAVGNTVVLNKSVGADGQDSYAIVDVYRLPAVYILIAIFFLGVIILGRLKGLSSILGLLLTVILLVKWMIPHILSGDSPLLVIVSAAIMIVLVSLYLAHGFNKRTTIAVGSSLLVLALAIGLAMLYTYVTHLSGAGSEEAFTLKVAGFPNLNLAGLLLGGMILGVLGVLDDITTGQAAAVEELHEANPTLPFHELYRRGFSIGREHIASLVNTLVLAYAGASLPLLLLFSTNPYQPFWVILNSEPMIEEIVRTLVGSMALILAVPLTTLFAAYIFSRQQHSSKTQ